jgi:hypothetical protein
VVIINGEIVQDKDPRALKARGLSAEGGAQQRQFGARITSVGGSVGGARGDATAPRVDDTRGATRAAPNGPLDGLAGMIGIQGKTVIAPALGDYVPASEVTRKHAGSIMIKINNVCLSEFLTLKVPMIYIVVIAVATVILQNWKVRSSILGFVAVSLFLSWCFSQVPVGAVGLYYLQQYSAAHTAQRPHNRGADL